MANVSLTTTTTKKKRHAGMYQGDQMQNTSSWASHESLASHRASRRFSFSSNLCFLAGCCKASSFVYCIPTKEEVTGFEAGVGTSSDTDVVKQKTKTVDRVDFKLTHLLTSDIEWVRMNYIFSASVSVKFNTSIIFYLVLRFSNYKTTKSRDAMSIGSN